MTCISCRYPETDGDGQMAGASYPILTGRMRLTSGEYTLTWASVTTLRSAIGVNFSAFVLKPSRSVNNLFDKVYFKKFAATGISNYYGDPRNVMLTLRAKF